MDNHAEILARYKRMREQARRLSGIIPDLLGRQDFETTAKALGLWVKGTVIFDGEEDMAILMDCALYAIGPDGRNAVERYAADHPAPPGSDEETVLEAKKRAYYSIFEVLRAVKGVGAEVRDVLRNQDRFLADVNFSYTFPRGAAFASRVLDFGDFIMTTGASVPLGYAVLKQASDYLERLGKTEESIGCLTAREQCGLAVHVARSYLADRGNGPHMLLANESNSEEDAQRAIAQAREEHESAGRYVPEGDDLVTAPIHADPRAGRNDPCPCGSGRKFKKCCGR